MAGDPQDIRDLTVIGAGPVGLSVAFWAGMREASTRIVDSLPDLGGQLTALYPEKWIFDVPGHPRVLARDLVERLREQALGQFDVPVHLETTAERISWEDDVVVLHTDAAGDLRSRAVVIAGGHGAFEPKRLPVTEVDLGPWEGRGVHYLVAEKQAFAGRRVAIVGGGDSALDWVVNLVDVAERVHLIHRRDGFRAHEATVRQVLDHVDLGRVDLHVPYTVRQLEGNGSVERLRLDGPAPRELEIDALLLQLGFSTKLGPLREWGLEIAKGAIVVDPLMRTNLPQVWACGDITTFDGKLKLIATGFAEAAVAVAQAVHSFRPEMKIQPKYSTNTGVPAATPAPSATAGGPDVDR
jgi:thioredoxin reductase (NADPH)